MNSKTELIVHWLERTIAMLVDDPDSIEVEVIEGAQVSVISIKLPRSDLGKVIGRQGKMADALRTFVDAYAGKAKTRFVLNIEG
jgi:hypothetical protein